MNDLKTAALAAYEEQRAATAQRQEDDRLKVCQIARQHFTELFGTEPDSVTADAQDRIIVNAAGLALRYQKNCLDLWGLCPHCGDMVAGKPVYNLQSLGMAVVDGFAPHWSHNCQPAPTPEPDPMLAALQEIAAELKRANDRSDTRGDSSPISPHPEPATDDPFMPPDEVWRWLPDAMCVAVDKSGLMYWYSGDTVAGSADWSHMNADFGGLGRRTLAGADWRITKRYRPAHL